MTELTPEAQAVKQSAEAAYWLWDQMCPADADTIAAAVLRAVAYEVAEDWNEETCDKILRIAAELEGAN